MRSLLLAAAGDIGDRRLPTVPKNQADKLKKPACCLALPVTQNADPASQVLNRKCGDLQHAPQRL